MVPFGLLLVSLLVFRGLGALGVEPLSDWRNAAAYALAVMFLFTASAHFTSTDLSPWSRTRSPVRSRS